MLKAAVPRVSTPARSFAHKWTLFGRFCCMYFVLQITRPYIRGKYAAYAWPGDASCCTGAVLSKSSELVSDLHGEVAKKARTWICNGVHDQKVRRVLSGMF